MRGEGEMSEPTDLPENLRKQIDDALARGDADRLPPEPPRARRQPPRRPPRGLPDPRPRNPQQLLLASALLALAGWVFRFPYHNTVLWVGLVGVAVALLTLLIKPQGYTQHYWRGQPVDLPPDSWTDRLYRLLYRG
jgi:hypothetical protein